MNSLISTHIGFLVMLLVVSNPTSLFAQEKAFSRYNKEFINSTFLNQEREIWIALPKEFDTAKKYPILVVLDAEMYFDLTTILIDNREKYGKLEPYIIVGIPNPNMKERSRNMTFSVSGVEKRGAKTDRFTNKNAGHANNFFQFLNQELVSYLKQNYGLNSQDITLLGHSFGGYFALIASTMDSNFTNFIAIDPSLWYSDDEVMLKMENSIQHLKENPLLAYFIAYQNGSENNSKKAKDLILFLKENGMKIQSWEFANENHGSVFLPSMISILREIGKNIDHIPRHKRKI